MVFFLKFSSKEKKPHRQFGGTPGFQGTQENSQHTKALRFFNSQQQENSSHFPRNQNFITNQGFVQDIGFTQNKPSSVNEDDHHPKKKPNTQKNTENPIRPQNNTMAAPILKNKLKSNAGIENDSSHSNDYRSFFPEVQSGSGLAGFFNKPHQETFERKHRTQPFDLIGEQSLLQQLFTEKLLIDDEYEDFDTPRNSEALQVSSQKFYSDAYGESDKE